MPDDVSDPQSVSPPCTSLLLCLSLPAMSDSHSPSFPAYVLPASLWLSGEDAKDCPAFLRHKEVLFNPSKLTYVPIPVKTAVQYPGDVSAQLVALKHCPL